jgi:nucleoside-diphosphate-sugar epimerase
MKTTLLLLLASAGVTSAFVPRVGSSLLRPRRSSSSLKMSIAVFGATGGTGGEVAFQALKNGQEVTCLCRDPTTLTVPEGSGGSEAGLPLRGVTNVVKGSVTNQADVDKVFEGQDVEGVVVALGGKTKDVGPTMLTDGTSCIINACKKYGVKRIAVVTSIGVGDSKDQAPFAFKILMATVMSSIFKDKNAQEELFAAGGPGADLDYCLVRPGGLTLEKPNGQINIIDGEAGSISRADVADFCLGAITQEDFPYLGKKPCLSSSAGTSWVKDRSAKTQGDRASK